MYFFILSYLSFESYFLFICSFVIQNSLFGYVSSQVSLNILKTLSVSDDLSILIFINMF